MAALMNLLSAGAAFGVVTAVFQWGWGASLIGVDRTGPIEAFLPVMMFAILFGLSMDYEVFLVSRIYEEWHRRGDNARRSPTASRRPGARSPRRRRSWSSCSARSSSAASGSSSCSASGSAGAVLLDALIVRCVLVPALMLLLGEPNWWLPAWLERILPQLNVEGSADDSAPEPVTAPSPA